MLQMRIPVSIIPNRSPPLSYFLCFIPLCICLSSAFFYAASHPVCHTLLLHTLSYIPRFPFLPCSSLSFLSLFVLDPYVKASLICDGRRLKKRKTSIKKNTLNPTYNEALVFDIPNENIESVSIIIAVMDYDW